MELVLGAVLVGVGLLLLGLLGGELRLSTAGRLCVTGVAMLVIGAVLLVAASGRGAGSALPIAGGAAVVLTAGLIVVSREVRRGRTVPASRRRAATRRSSGRRARSGRPQA